MTAAPLPGAELVRRFDRKLGRIIGQDLPVLKRVKKFLIKSGGKRIRPITHYYFTQLLGYEGRDWEDVGAIGELIHGASLLHDDVVDEASIRRGHPSVNALEGNKTAILAGDYMLGCGLDHLNTLRDSGRLLDIFTRVLRMLSVGDCKSPGRSGHSTRVSRVRGAVGHALSVAGRLLRLLRHG